jgi:hypothetical protein
MSQYRKDLKYMYEGRFSFGVCMIQNVEGTLEGKRMNLFVYTSLRLIEIAERDKMQRAEVYRVQNLSKERHVTQGWAGITKRPKGMVFEEDELHHIPGIVMKTQMKIEDTFFSTQYYNYHALVTVKHCCYLFCAQYILAKSRSGET